MCAKRRQPGSKRSLGGDDVSCLWQSCGTVQAEISASVSDVPASAVAILQELDICQAHASAGMAAARLLDDLWKRVEGEEKGRVMWEERSHSIVS